MRGCGSGLQIGRSGPCRLSPGLIPCGHFRVCCGADAPSAGKKGGRGRPSPGKGSRPPHRAEFSRLNAGSIPRV